MGAKKSSLICQYIRAAKFELREEQYALGKVEYEHDPHSSPALKFDFSEGPIPVGSGLWEKLLPVAFHKRTCFEYEREWRGALYQDSRPDCYGCNVTFDLKELISAVYVGPRADKLFFDIVGSIMEKFELQKPLERSALLVDPKEHRGRPERG